MSVFPASEHRAEVLAGAGSPRLAGGVAEVTIPAPRHFLFVRVSRA